MNRAEEIGISLGTGLSHVRYRPDDNIDSKSRLGREMPDWWISSAWVPLPKLDDDNENDEAGSGNNPVHDD